MAILSAAPRSRSSDQFLDIQCLAQRGRTQFLSKCPFLTDLPATSFIRGSQPEYLTLALAAVGSLVSENSEAYSLELWDVAAKRLTGTLEVLTDEVRNIDTVKTVRKPA